MNCPVCKSRLIISGKERCESLVEHVCSPNDTPSLKDKYICSNKNCVTLGKCFWIGEGEIFGNTKNISFINNNYGPFGSITRKIQVEVYKANLPNHSKELKLFNKYIFRWNYIYESNLDGDVLSKKKEIEILKRDDIMWVYVIPIWVTVPYLFESFYRNKKQYKSSHSKFTLKQIYEDFYGCFPNDRRPLYVIVRTILKILNPFLLKEIKYVYNERKV